MTDLTKQKIAFAATEETIEGTPEVVAASDFIEMTESGSTINGPRELKEINTITGDRLKTKSRKTIQNGDGSVGTYLRAGEIAGDVPETDILLRSFGFTLEQVATTTASTGTNTTTTINVASGDNLKYKVGQVILIKDPVNGDHISPISALADTLITVLIPAAVAFDNTCSIQKVSNYRLNDNSASFTARKFYNGAVKQEVPYCKTSSIELSNIKTGEVPTSKFTFAGINFSEILETLAVTPAFLNTEVPFSLDACLYKNGVSVEANEISFKFDQNLSIKKTLCSKNGNKSNQTVGKYTTSGTANIYKNDQTIDFPLDDTTFSLFISLYVPGTVAGSKENVVSIYIPVVKTNEKDSNGDIDGNIISAISFKAEPSSSETSYPIIMFS